MSELKSLLTALIKGQGDLDATRVALTRLLAEQPQQADTAEKLLLAAKKAGLDSKQFDSLHAQLRSAVDDDDAIVLDDDDAHLVSDDRTAPNPRLVDPDATVLAAADDAIDPDATVLGSSADYVDPDATVLGSSADYVDPDATVLGSVDDYVDPDRTVLATDEDATAVNLPSSEDATEVRAADDDATVIDTGDEDATVVDATEEDEDATLVNIAGDDDATLINAGVDDDATLVNAGADDDATVINAGDDDEDATAVNVVADSDATEINVDGRDEDATAVNATVDPDRTAVMGGGDEIDILMDASDDPADTARNTGGDWPTSVGAGASSGPTAGVDREFQEGDTLRGRFLLLSKLGEGGMGAVWKGKDLLKEEARDRNPFVAIKLLQGDFKSHPESFIALQREAAKQQRLAHPNIATVYDFDRDEVTGTVFLTMEVMDGVPMDAFVRKMPADGLSEEEAMPLIHDLCEGLKYAHNAKLVHSDLKPGNAFMVNDPERELGRVKLLDFGIARASKTKGDAEGETTLFDPGQLGALTPTYATIEMFEGEDPDPRDDIYALAIMAYQLFTGKHPYGKKSAPKAKELGLEPAPIEKLDKRQNKGLRRGLAFHREDRTPTVEDFLEDITRRKSRTPLFVGIAAAILILMVAGLWSPVNNLINERAREDVIATLVQPGLDNIRQGLELARGLGPEQEALVLDDDRVKAAVAGFIAQGDEQSIGDGLTLIKGYSPEWQREIKSADLPARQAIFDLYEGRRLDAFDVEAQKYDFAAANETIDELDALFPDSAQVLALRNSLNTERDNKLAELNEAYKNFLADPAKLLPNAAETDIGDVLATVRAIDAEHRLLSDERLRTAFVDTVETAFNAKDYERANTFLEASVAYAPDDAKLNDLRYQVESQLTQIRNAQRVADLQQKLEGQLTSIRTLADFQSVRDELIELADLSPTNPVLTQMQDGLKRAFSAELTRLTQAKDWIGGEQLIVDFAKLLEVPYLTAQRGALSEAEKAAGYQLAMSPEREQAIAERTAAVDALLADPKFTSEWEIALKTPYKELIALLPLGDPALAPVRNTVARLYLSKATEAREVENLAKAEDFIKKGRLFYPGLKNFDDEEIQVAAVRAERERREAERKRLAQIDGLKNDFLDLIKANDLAAKDVLPQLAALGVTADDPFLSKEAPLQLAQAYGRLAEARAAQDDYTDALKFLEEGLAYAPDLDALVKPRATYQAEVKKREREFALYDLFKTTNAIDIQKTAIELDKLKADFPGRYPDVLKKLSSSRADALRGYTSSKDLSIPGLAERMKEYRALFPDGYEALDKDVVAGVEKRIVDIPLKSTQQVAALARPLAEFKQLSSSRQQAVANSIGDSLASQVKALERRDRGGARRLWEAAIKTIPGHRGLTQAEPFPDLAEIKKAYSNLKKGDLADARKDLAAAKAKMSNHPDIPPLEKEIQDAVSSAEAQYAEYVKFGETAKHTDQRTLDRMYASIDRLWGDNPAFKKIKIEPPPKGACLADLAGFGNKRGGSCYDLIDKRKKGPELVVVPAGGGSAAPFAIGKYEVSVKDFNEFCKDTTKCEARPRKESRLPVTGIPVALAEDYAKWLSGKASALRKKTVTYRLPTAAEWEHAAKAGGQDAGRKVNCRVTQGATIVTGHALDNVKSGQQNGWGIANAVGNAQEWVKSSGGVAARGGAFEDPLDKCGVSLSKPHGGGADGITGFRLVRELG